MGLYRLSIEEKEIIFIDKHAAHERIIFEKNKQMMKRSFL